MKNSHVYFPIGIIVVMCSIGACTKIEQPAVGTPVALMQAEAQRPQPTIHKRTVAEYANTNYNQVSRIEDNDAICYLYYDNLQCIPKQKSPETEPEQ